MTSLPRRAPVTRATAFWRVVAMYVVVQILSYLFLLESCSRYSLADMWVHGALGPLAAVEAVPRFKYHSVVSNGAFVLGCLALLVAPFAYVIRPHLLTLIVSAIGLILWCLFGIGMTIDHM